jgi:hypothetical protein
VVDDELDAPCEKPADQRVSGVLDAELVIGDASGACAHSSVSRNDRDVIG